MRRNNNMYIVIITVLLLCVTIGYAVLNSTLNITGKSNISKNTWDVYFDNMIINENGIIPNDFDYFDTEMFFEVDLEKPGDFCEFTIDVINDGTIDAMIGDLENDIYSFSNSYDSQNFFKYTVEYHNGYELEENQLLEKQTYTTLKVRVEFKENINPEDLPTTDDIFEFDLLIDYIQSDEDAIRVKNNGLRSVEIFNFQYDYEFEEGMTWREFLESDYNIDENGEKIFNILKANKKPVVGRGYVYVVYQYNIEYPDLIFMELDDKIIADYRYYQFAI